MADHTQYEAMDLTAIHSDAGSSRYITTSTVVRILGQAQESYGEAQKYLT